MAGRGMGCATRGGGAVESGPANKMVSETSTSTGVPMLKHGGMAINQHKKMAMGMKKGGSAKKMMKGGAC